MRFYSTHLKPHEEPVLIPERFAWWALLFGPLWLLRHRAWIGFGLSVALISAVVALASPIQAGIVVIGLHLLLGLVGEDTRRWSLERRGYLETDVICARDELDALRELLHQRPDLAERYRPEPA